MKLLDTYKAVINHQVGGYTLIGRKQFADVANLKRLQLLIFPELDKLALGKKLPKTLELLSNGWYVDLSYNFEGDLYPLYLHIKDGLLFAVSKKIGDADVADVEETAYGYESFMKKEAKMNNKYKEQSELEEFFADAIETSNSYLEEMDKLGAKLQKLEAEDEGTSYMLSAMCEHITDPQMVNVLFDFINNGWTKISVGKKIEDFPLVFVLPKERVKQSVEFSVAFYKHDENAVFSNKLIVFSKDGIITKITYSNKKTNVR